MDDWTDQLKAGDVRPRSTAAALITAEVRRRQRRRRALGAACAAAVVVAGVVLLVPGGRDRARDPDGAPASSPSQPTTPSAHSGPPVTPATFTCPTESPVFTEHSTPSQQRINEIKHVYDVVTRSTYAGFAVHRAEVYLNVGVVALVTGDLAEARRRLGAVGVAEVGAWDPSLVSADLDETGQLEQLLQWRLDPVMRVAQRQPKDRRDSASLAYWKDEDAVLVQWKAPVPAAVQALEGIRFASGSRIVVRGVRYSHAEMEVAQLRRLDRWLESTGNQQHWATSHPCGDYSGLVVGMVPEFLVGADVPALQAEIAAAIGMPAYVVPEERPVPLNQ